MGRFRALPDIQSRSIRFSGLVCHKRRSDASSLSDGIHQSQEWNQHGNIGLVVGATWPEEIKIIRKQNPEMPLLIPGVGAQGGCIDLVSKYAIGPDGKMGIINSSRSIIHASAGKYYDKAARSKAEELRNQINLYRR
jgi:orotidine-5'-phosphate decarboxylase